MNKSNQELINELLANPDDLIKKKPFHRGLERGYQSRTKTAYVGELMKANLPNFKKKVISQEQFLRELDTHCHDVLFDDNIPAICVKIQDGSYVDIVYEKMAIPFQKIIRNSQVLRLTGNPMVHSLSIINPTETQNEDFVTFKQFWEDRNMDGLKKRMVEVQMSCGDAGMLFYMNEDDEIHARILSYEDGYQICPHCNANGEHILESVYYVCDNVETIDSYSKDKMYRHERIINTDGTTIDNNWKITEFKHGFDEIPLITKRGDVPWNDVQTDIEAYEILYNIFNVIQKRFGWGIFYLRGNLLENGKKIAGSVVLQDNSLEGNGDAKFLTPPSPEGMIDTLKELFRTIQIGSGTTIILPDDIHISGDITGIAVQMTQQLDIETAESNVIEWQNVASKMSRLWKQGVAMELVRKGQDATAVTRFSELKIHSCFKVWRPISESEYNQNLVTLVGSNIISHETATERCTERASDEKLRLKKEKEQLAAEEEAKAEKERQAQQNQGKEGEQ